MKKISSFLIFLASYFISLPLVNAQIGWQWGKGGYTYCHVPIGALYEGLQTVVDRSGNIFNIGVDEYADSIVLGTTTVTNPNQNQQLLITKYDPSGNLIWYLDALDATSSLNIGTSYICTDSAGNLYLFASYSSPTLTLGSHTISNSLGIMCFIAKISPIGNVVWIENVAHAISGGNAQPGCIIADDNGNVYLAGSYSGTNITIGGTTLTNADPTGVSNDIFFAKYNSLGIPVWIKECGGDGSDEPLAIALGGSNSIYISAQYASDSITAGPFKIYGNTLSLSSFFLMHFDSSGTIQWFQEIHDHLSVNGMGTDHSNNIYLIGSIDTPLVLGTSSLPFEGVSDFFIAKYDSIGTLIWAHSGGGNLVDVGSSFAADNCGNLWITGGFGGPGGYVSNFSGHTLTTPVTSTDPMFIVQYDTSGNYISGITLASGGDDQIGIGVDTTGNLYIGGDYVDTSLIFGHDTLNVQPKEVDTITHMSYSIENFFLAKYTYSTNGCYTSNVDQLSSSSTTVDIYPNPTFGIFNIHCNTVFPSYSRAILYDITGRLIGSYLLEGNNYTISVRGLNPGIYQCNIFIGTKSVIVKKVVILN